MNDLHITLRAFAQASPGLVLDHSISTVDNAWCPDRCLKPCFFNACTTSSHHCLLNLALSLISAVRRPTCPACCMASTSARGDAAGPTAAAPEFFTAVGDLQRFLQGLGPLYEPYATDLWAFGVRSLSELAHASAGTLREAGVHNSLHIDNIKACAGKWQE